MLISFSGAKLMNVGHRTKRKHYFYIFYVHGREMVTIQRLTLALSRKAAKLLYLNIFQ